MKKYSVIIPVYNAERTLRRCLDSLLNQNRTDVEIIAVNDGSADSSPEILAAYKDKYSCISVFNIPDSGVSKARNTGIEAAEGKYILFVDSDDYVSDHYFEVLDTFKDEDLCVFARRNIGSEQSDSSFFDSFDNSAAFAKQLEKLTIGRKMLPPWNKRFKREIIQKHKVRFVHDFAIGEDFDFCMNYARYCSSVKVSGNAVYCLDVSDNHSLSRKYRPLLNEKLKAVYLHIESMLNACNNSCIDKNSLFTAVDYLYARNVFACISEEFKNGKPGYFKNRKKYREICRDFQNSIGNTGMYANTAHRIIRMLLKMNIIFPLYLIAYLVKRK